MTLRRKKVIVARKRTERGRESDAKPREERKLEDRDVCPRSVDVLTEAKPHHHHAIKTLRTLLSSGAVQRKQTHHNALQPHWDWEKTASKVITITNARMRTQINFQTTKW